MAASTMCTAWVSSITRKHCYDVFGIIRSPLFRGASYSTALSVPTNKDVMTRGNRSTMSRRPRREPAAPRTDKMTVDQDWSSVYPTAASFKPSTVPLPIRMGYPVKRGVPLEKKGNLELIKIPNFLHLTPAAIKKQCAALNVFCTKWPETLDSEAKCEQHFPIQVKMTDFVFAGPSVRNPKARVTTLTVKVSSLNLDDHGRKKLIKLAGERHNKETDMLTFTADRCPLRRQNYDYAMYLLTVLYHESSKHEPWEKEKTEADMEEYLWESSTSERNAVETLLRMKGSEDGSAPREELLSSRPMQEYRNSVTNLKNAGESESTLLQYKQSVKNLLNL
ncbi:small ribosomal subunit protein mS35 [Acipenser ruthenus]|nr:small ribosomal subunit protein mS35 [Acipenser ruthenus]